MRTILVTGGAGFIGSNFVRHALAAHDDWHVTTLDKLTYAGRLENLEDVLDDPRHEFVRGDIADPAVSSALVERADVVVHFAAETHVDRSIQGAADFIRTDVFGTYMLLDAARRAFQCMQADVKDGGVIFTDSEGHRWIEEYIVDPPTHILNGFMWAGWGVYDLALSTGDSSVLKVWGDSVETLKSNLNSYDAGYWSLYEQSGTRLRMMASHFYHRLHIVQLKVMAKLDIAALRAAYDTPTTISPPKRIVT